MFSRLKEPLRLKPDSRFTHWKVGNTFDIGLFIISLKALELSRSNRVSTVFSFPF